MTALASSAAVAGDAGTRARSVTSWAARGALAAAVVAAIALRAPDQAALTVMRAFGARIVREGRVPLRLGPEIFGAPNAWDGGLGWLGAFAAWCAGVAGPAFTTFSTCAFALAALAFVAARARRRAAPALALGAAALAAACASDALRDGGGIESATFAAALYFLLDRPALRSAVLASLLAVLWCNVSAQGLFAPLLGAVAALGTLLDRRPAAERRWAAIACAGTVLATFATPAGWTFPALAFEALRVDRALEWLVTYHPADVSPFAYRTGFTLAMLTALAFGAGRLRASDALLWASATLLALANGLYLPIFGVLAAPLLAASAAERLDLPAVATERRAAALAAGTVACAALAAAAAFVPAALGLRVASPAEATVLARTLTADGRAHRLFCATADWCGVAEAEGAPLVSGYMDGRVEAFPADACAEQRDVARLKGDWRGRLDAERVDAVLVRRDRAFATLLAARPGWRQAGETDSLVLFVRRP